MVFFEEKLLHYYDMVMHIFCKLLLGSSFILAEELAANCSVLDSGALSDPKQKLSGKTFQLQKRSLPDTGASLDGFDVILR